MNKNIFLITLLVAGFALGGNAQLNKLKNKANNLKKKTSVKTPSKSVEAVEEKNEENKKMLKVEAKAERNVHVLDSIFSSEAILAATSDEDVDNALYHLKSSVGTIKSYYAESSRLEEFQGSYDNYKVKVKNELETREKLETARFYLKQYSEMAEKRKNDFPMSSFLDVASMERYNKYQEYKNMYESSGKTLDDLAGYISNMEDYYSKTIPGAAPVFKKYMLEEMLSRSFDENSWKPMPKSGIKSIEYHLGKFTEPCPSVATVVNEVKQSMEDQKAKLREYIDSGEHDKYMKEQFQKEVDARRMATPAKKDASLEGIVKSKHNSGEYGTLKRVIITGNSWYVEKNAFGIPLEKHIKIQVATSKDGVCDRRDGKLFKTYEGGGKYGPTKLSHYWGTAEMNCDNLFK